jgi:hypothetical protein
MKRKLSLAKSINPAEDLMKACGVLANEAGLTDERRVFFTKDDREPGWLSGWTAQLNDELEIEIDAVIGDEDEHRFRVNERIGNPLQAIWSVTVWPPPPDDGETISPIVEIRDLPFADALRIASAIIRTHKFKSESGGT